MLGDRADFSAFHSIACSPLTQSGLKEAWSRVAGLGPLMGFTKLET